LRAVQGRVNVTRAEVADYYAANRERSFTRPERRRLAIVVAKTRARAQQARKAIASGTGWRKVAKRYSIAPRALTQVSRPADGPQGQQPPAYIRSVFAARQRELQGPVKTPYGYLVFRVIDTKAATRVPLARVRGWIGRLLRAKQRRAAIAHFFRDLQKKYQGRTQCATEFAIADFCANAPKRTNRAA
jgi:parvulin-like peptidyl-prolyl isomerase